MIHFADNNKARKKGTPGYDPLFKVQYPFEVMMKGMRACWTAGQHVTVDESMVRYMGRAISYVQYMPAKPIKHGIKVFAISGVLLAFKVYTGKEDDDFDWSALNVCKWLCEAAGLTKAKGRTLYADNYYTSMDLARFLRETWKWNMCGTITPTDKQSRADEDIPFLRLSNGARNSIPRGWFREACIKLQGTYRPHYVQCTTWKDKKQVCFLYSGEVGRSDGLSVLRHVKGEQTRIRINGPRAQAEYQEYFNAVDRNDRDSSDYSTSIRTNRYYIRLLCWCLDRVIHTVYIVVCWLAKEDGWVKWRQYVNDRQDGRRDFQIDLGMALLNRAIEWDWTGDKRPQWVRQRDWIPCDCEECYFCLNGLTNGIDHVRNKKVITVFANGAKRRTHGCTEERVPIKTRGYCRMCYRQQSDDLSENEKRKRCRSSRKGCIKCQEPICATCWGQGYDWHWVDK